MDIETQPLLSEPTREVILLRVASQIDAFISIEACDKSGSIHRPNRLGTSMGDILSARWYSAPSQGKALATRVLYSSLVPGGILGSELSKAVGKAWAATITPLGLTTPFLSALRDGGQMSDVQGVTAVKGNQSYLIQSPDGLPWFNCLAGEADSKRWANRPTDGRLAVGRSVLHTIRGAVITIAEAHMSGTYPESAKRAFEWILETISPRLPADGATTPDALTLAVSRHGFELADALVETVARMVRLGGGAVARLPSLSVSRHDLPEVTRASLVITNSGDVDNKVNAGGRFDCTNWRPGCRVLQSVSLADKAKPGAHERDGWLALESNEDLSVNGSLDYHGRLLGLLSTMPGCDEFCPGDLACGVAWLSQFPSVEAVHEALPDYTVDKA